MTEIVTTWQRFAEITIKTNDLDPMYEVFRKMNFAVQDRNWMGRFILTFLLFYDAGQAVRVAKETNDNSYWNKLYAIYPRAKRGIERRHFRGFAGLNAIEKLQSFKMSPWEILIAMYPGDQDDQNVTYTHLYKNMTSTFAGTQFGTYFIWKLYDIFNICLDMPISLSSDEAIKYMPDEPRKAAEHFFGDFKHGLELVTREIRSKPHPVLPGRTCGLAEAETVLCMMKGFFKTKTHEIGDDIQDKWDQLVDFPELRVLLPPGVERGLYVRGELK